MKSLRKKFLTIIIAMILVYSTCICAMAEVVTYDNGSQGIILGKKSEEGTITVVNNAFVVYNNSGKSVTVDVPDTKGVKVDNEATLTVTAYCVNPLNYKYNAKKNTLVITEIIPNTNKASKPTSSAKPSGKNVATLGDFASIIQYATSLGWVIDPNNSPYSNVYYMSTSKNTYHIMMTANGSKNGMLTSDGYEFDNISVDEFVLFFETMAKY